MPTRSTMLTKVRLKFEGHGAVVGLALELLEYAVPIARERLGDFVPYP